MVDISVWRICCTLFALHEAKAWYQFLQHCNGIVGQAVVCSLPLQIMLCHTDVPQSLLLHTVFGDVVGVIVHC